MELAKVKNDLAVLNTLKIGHEEDGSVYVQNFEIVRDTLESLLEGKDKIIVTTEENSVKFAQEANTKMNKAKEDIANVFANEEQRLKNELSKLTEPKKQLIHFVDNCSANIKMQVMYAKEQWKLQAIEDNQRDCSVDLTPEMFSDVKIRVDSAKKTIEHNVMLKTQEIEKEYKRRQQDEDALEQCCRLQDLDFSIYKVLLETKSLGEVLDLIAKQKEEADKRKRELEKAEQERLAKEQAVEQAEQAVETIRNNVVPNLQEVPEELDTDYDAFELNEPEPLKRWIIEIRTTKTKQQLLKRFCEQHGIEVRVPNGITSNR